MKTRIILSVVVALFVISLVLVAATNIENNQTLSERTEFEIYQDYIDSQKRTDSTMLEWYDIILHSDDDLTNTVNILEDEKEIQDNLSDEYTSLPDIDKTDKEIYKKIVGDVYDGQFSNESLIDNLKHQKESEHDIRITLEHFGCAKTCPVYSVIINGDGTVLYKGLKNVKEIGKQEYEIPADTITELDKFVSAAYHGKIKDKYGSQDGTENTVIITIEFGEAKRIVIYDNSGPELLKQFEEKIEQIAMIKELI